MSGFISKNLAVFLLLAFLITGGCSTPPAQSRHFIVLLDVSGSITPAAETDAVSATVNLRKQMHHGDSITVIPIKSDAETEAEGSIIRHTFPAVREAYDQERRRFTTELHGSLEKLKANALAHPGDWTDILGSLDLAQQEISSSRPGGQIILIALSDFIQEDRERNFKTDRAFATPAKAQELAQTIAKEHQFSLTNTKVYLGEIKSGELAAIGQQRRKAIQVFWIQYFSCAGAKPQYAIDGPGLLESFVQRSAP